MVDCKQEMYRWALVSTVDKLKFNHTLDITCTLAARDIIARKRITVFH